MTLDDAQQIKEWIEDNTDVEIEIRESYSGRSMYGTEVTAFIADNSEEALLAIGAASASLNISMINLPFRVDNMGRAWVIY
jgi:hypothetical protein